MDETDEIERLKRVNAALVDAIRLSLREDTRIQSSLILIDALEAAGAIPPLEQFEQ